MLLISALLYLSARAFQLNLPTWPLKDGWFFNPLAWQFIFAIGLFVGRRLRRGCIPFDRRLAVLCFMIFGSLSFDGQRLPQSFAGPVGWFSRELRCQQDRSRTNTVMHFLALAYVIIHSGLMERLRHTFLFKPLALIGRHSLPVFATGCVLVAIGEVIVETRPEEFSYQLTLGAAIVTIGALVHYLVAVLAARRSAIRPLVAGSTRHGLDEEIRHRPCVLSNDYRAQQTGCG